MDSLLVSSIFLGSLGFLSSITLKVISDKFKVDENPLIDEVEEILPNANCGGCGFPGCRNFAQAIVETRDPNLYCPVGGAEVMEKVANLLGMQVGSHERMVARVACAGTLASAKKSSIYVGIEDCNIAANIYVGDKACQYGCLGLGSCDKVCPVDAIDILNGIAVVNEDKCIGCGLCVKACPRDLISMVPASQKIWVMCKSLDRGADTSKKCKVGCIGCLMCKKKCPEDAYICTPGKLCTIDYNKCTNCGECVEVCPKNSILDLSKEKVGIML